jgi:hypothetical protein
MKRKSVFLVLLLLAVLQISSPQTQVRPPVSTTLSPLEQAKQIHIGYFSSIREGAPFLIGDGNWRDVLCLVPVSTWRISAGTEEEIKKVPVLIYHQEDNGEEAFDIDAVVNYLKNSDYQKLHVVGELNGEILDILVAPKPDGVGLKPGDIEVIDPRYLHYFFYGGPDKAVVCQDRYGLGLMAAVYASYLNAPLYFEGHFDPDLLEGRQVITVGRVDSVEGDEHYPTVRALQQHYAKITGTDKAILVNSRDRQFEAKLFPVPEGQQLEFETGNGDIIHRLFYRLSLAAPFLAAAKQEVIIDVRRIPYLEYVLPYEEREYNPPYVVTDYMDVNRFLAGFFKDIGWQPRFLTVMSDFAHVEYQVPRQKHNTIGFERSVSLPADGWFYADPDLDGCPDIYVGRMMGYTLSDLSAWLARTLFYQPPQSHRSLFLGKSADVHGETKAASMYDAALAFGGTDAAYILGGDEIHDRGAEWKDKDYITFRDHGYEAGAGLTYDEIRDKIGYFECSPILHIDACLTAYQFWMDKEDDLFNKVKKSYSLHLVRHGALAYIGAQMPHGGHLPWPIFYRLFARDKYKTLGECFYHSQLIDTMVSMENKGIYYKRGHGDLKTSFQQYVLWGDPTLEPGVFIEYSQRDRLERRADDPNLYKVTLHYYAPRREVIEPTLDEAEPEIVDYDRDYYNNDYLFFAGPYAWSKEGQYVFELGPFAPGQRFDGAEVEEITGPAGSYPMNVEAVQIVKEYVVSGQKYVYVYLQDQSLPYTLGDFSQYQFNLRLIPAGR